ncbi:hypothetical protein [Pararhizobium gei]|uniref:hypothetical protein n=1 Tax=Pararhizobium gei TaxID=1395951 RepID=UPI0023D9A9C7|nr:hypothetical protein [Rhizobium gei]
MIDENVDLSFLAKQGQKIIEDMRAFRQEASEIRTLALQTYEYSRRIERRQSELRDDLEVTIKMEFGGGFAHLQTAVERSLSRIEEMAENLARRVDALERKS